MTREHSIMTINRRTDLNKNKIYRKDRHRMPKHRKPKTEEKLSRTGDPHTNNCAGPSNVSRLNSNNQIKVGMLYYRGKLMLNLLGSRFF